VFKSKSNYSCKLFFYNLPFSHNTSVTDRWTDRQTDRRHIVPLTLYSIAVARKNRSMLHEVMKLLTFYFHSSSSIYYTTSWIVVFVANGCFTCSRRCDLAMRSFINVFKIFRRLRQSWKVTVSLCPSWRSHVTQHSKLAYKIFQF